MGAFNFITGEDKVLLRGRKLISYSRFLHGDFVLLHKSETMNEITRYETPWEYCAAIGIKSQHPLVSVIDYSCVKEYRNPRGLCCGYYVVSLYCGETDCGVRYGRNMYDYQDGTLFFTAPGQIVTFSNHRKAYQPKENCIALLFHPDYFRGTDLAKHIGRYKFFSYEVHEALHLSETEMEDIRICFHSIEQELKQRPDRHSATIVCTAIELLLNYCARFYDRQFITRHPANLDVVSRFETLLNDYFVARHSTDGLPTVKYFADKLNFSPDYLSCLVKKETGRNIQEHIHYKLMEVAKDCLCFNDKSISQIAYELGFEYPQHFSRLFKSKVGVTPSEYRQMNLMK